MFKDLSEEKNGYNKIPTSICLESKKKPDFYSGNKKVNLCQNQETQQQDFSMLTPAGIHLPHTTLSKQIPSP